MTEVNRKKVNLVVSLLIIIVLGSLLFYKGCFKKEYIDDNNNKQNNYEEIEFDKDLEFNNNTENISPIVYKNNNNDNDIPEPPKIELNDIYQIEVGDTNFKLPVINEVDSSNNELLVIITYYFKGIYENDFKQVDNFSINEIGTYKINYQVTDRYNQTVSKSILIEITDSINPIIEGYIEEYEPLTGLVSYIPVSSNSIINKPLKIIFSDNHEIDYAEYYKAVYEYIDGNNTLEQESMMNVIDIDLNNDFYLIEDGEYHIRAYDISGNYYEYVVTIDCMNPVVNINYQKIDSSSVLVTITLDEEVKILDGFTISEDKKLLSKIYYENTIENIVIEDLAGNKMDIPIIIDDILTVNFLQNNIITQSNQLNVNDGDISILITGSNNYQVTYILDDVTHNYLDNSVLDKEGTYYFKIVNNDETIEFYLYISKQDIMD